MKKHKTKREIFSLRLVKVLVFVFAIGISCGMGAFKLIHNCENGIAEATEVVVEQPKDVQETVVEQEEVVQEEIEKQTEIVVEQEEVVQEIETVVEQPKVEQNSENGFRSLGTFKLTAYCPCRKCCGSYADNRPIDENGNPIVYTASGAVAKEGITIATDTNVVPYGTKVVIDGYGEYISQDCGGGINGNEIDVYFNDHSSAIAFGVQYREVLIYEGV